MRRRLLGDAGWRREAEVLGELAARAGFEVREAVLAMEVDDDRLPFVALREGKRRGLLVERVGGVLRRQSPAVPDRHARLPHGQAGVAERLLVPALQVNGHLPVRRPLDARDRPVDANALESEGVHLEPSLQIALAGVLPTEMLHPSSLSVKRLPEHINTLLIKSQTLLSYSHREFHVHHHPRTRLL